MWTACAPRTSSSFLFFNDTATTEIYTLSLHDALPICLRSPLSVELDFAFHWLCRDFSNERDRKSTRPNSSHRTISYAVFCLYKHTLYCGRHPLPWLCLEPNGPAAHRANPGFFNGYGDHRHLRSFPTRRSSD